MVCGGEPEIVAQNRMRKRYSFVFIYMSFVKMFVRRLNIFVVRHTHIRQ